MDFSHDFHVSSDVDITFAALSNLEKVAPCMPGAQLEEVDGNVYRGRMKVKVGPVSIGYAGSAELVEADGDAKRITIHAAGKEAKSSGTAKADVIAQLSPEDGGTLVSVVTHLDVTGQAATLGRSVLPEVSARIIQQFAERLEVMLAEQDDTGTDRRGGALSSSNPVASESSADGRSPASDTGGSGNTVASTTDDADNSLSLWSVAGPVILKRLLPVVGVVIVIAAIWITVR